MIQIKMNLYELITWFKKYDYQVNELIIRENEKINDLKKTKQMELTGKCKEDFEEWVYNHICDDNKIKRPYEIYDYPDSIKWGVYLDFFDSFGLNITITLEFDYGYIIQENRYDEIEEVKRWYSTRSEVRNEVITKANQIYNEKHS